MKILKPENPNTLEGWNEKYEQFTKKEERLNEWFLNYIHKHRRIMKGDILEVGCGFGRTIHELSKLYPANYSGRDFSDVAINKANELYPYQFECEDARQMKDSESFDLVMCLQTLEHVDNPERIVANLKRAVNRGGYLLITVPFPKSSLSRGVFWHVNEFTPDDWRKWLPGCQMERIGKNHHFILWKK